MSRARGRGTERARRRELSRSLSNWRCLMEKAMILSQEQIDYCMECGVCTGSCPISRVMTQLFPAADDQATLDGPGRDGAAGAGAVGLPDLRPMQHALSGADRLSRSLPGPIGNWPERQGNLPQLSHHGDTPGHCQLCRPEPSSSSAPTGRRKWGTSSSSGDIFYFVGCAPISMRCFKPGAGCPGSAQEHPQAAQSDGHRAGHQRR